MGGLAAIGGLERVAAEMGGLAAEAAAKVEPVAAAAERVGPVEVLVDRAIGCARLATTIILPIAKNVTVVGPKSQAVVIEKEIEDIGIETETVIATKTETEAAMEVAATAVVVVLQEGMIGARGPTDTAISARAKRKYC